MTGVSAEDWIERAAAVAPRTEAFIDGRFVPAASGRTFTDIAGRDGRPIAQVAEGGTEDVDRAVSAAYRAFDDRRWADQTPADRKRVLLKFADLIRANRDELALLESLDVGKPIRDTLAVDVPSAATTIQWYAETIDKAYGDVGPTGPDALSLVTREPIGVVAATVPWNCADRSRQMTPASITRRAMGPSGVLAATAPGRDRGERVVVPGARRLQERGQPA